MAFNSIISANKSCVEARNDLKLIHADVLEGLRGLPSCSVDLTVTSPPYNMEIEYDSHNDTMSTTDYWDWLKSVWEECYRVTKDNGRICVNGPFYNLMQERSFWLDECWQSLSAVGWKFKHVILWLKARNRNSCNWGSWASPSCPGIWSSDEMILVAYKGSPTNPPEGREPCITADEFKRWTIGTWNIPTESATRVGHPAPFPVELPERCIKLFAYKGDTILDPFNGSGSTGIAAIKSGCKYIGIDISETYLELSKKRLFEAIANNWA